MATATKDEIKAELEAAFLEFEESATKAELQRLLDHITSHEAASPGPVQELTLIDPGGYATTFKLDTGEVAHEAARETYPDAIEVSGNGPNLTLDLQGLMINALGAFDFAAHPGIYPIKATFSTPDPQTQSPEEAAA